MSNDLLTVKASFDEEIRRFSVDSTINFISLTNLVHQLFHITEKNRYSLLYIDNENDNITLSTDVELEEAKRFTSKSENKTLRLLVQIENTGTGTKTSPKENCCESENECALMKYVGISIFAVGFFCRPFFALCFLAGLFLFKRFRKGVSKCCWSGSGCSWADCSSWGRSWGCSESNANSSSSSSQTEETVKQSSSDAPPSEEKKSNNTIINWQPLLKQLQEMGFSNVKQNIQLLTKYNGNIDNTVAELVQLAQ